MAFRVRPGYTTTDGHRYISTPTDVPQEWHRWRDGDTGELHYGSGVYEIRRRPYGDNRFTYEVIRDVDGKAVNIGVGGFSLLMDAKAAAVRNAQGSDYFNWA